MSAMSPNVYFVVLGITLLALGVLSIAAVNAAFKAFDAWVESFR